MGKKIQTEVDSLVSLIQVEEKISVRDAAKKLSVPTSTVSEWASFLEEEGVINIEYKFTTPFLVKKKLSTEQIKQLKGKVKEEKDLFDRKSKSTLTYLNKLEEEVETLKELFDDLGKNFKSKLSTAKKEFKELKKAEKEKEKLNKEVIDSKQKFMKQVEDINKHLLEEQKSYKGISSFLYNQSKIESEVLDIQEDEFELIKKTDKMLSKKLKTLKKALDKKKSKVIKKKKKSIGESKSNLKRLESKYTKLKDALDKDKKKMEELLKKNKEQEKQIEILKKDVISKIDTESKKFDKTIDDVEKVPSRLKSLMRKKNKILKILNKVRYNESMLKEKLLDLMKKGSTINLKDDSQDIIKEIEELETGLDDITKKKSFFEKEVKKIFDLLKIR
ncbi:hypothetical protein GF361_04380 [Candidatus Woesearchaeota archaeon]|nr:hypothetical protein [Candidatus Woesearchaeota archaeon]